MKKLLILLFSIMISFNSYGEWILVSISKGGKSIGDKFFVDIDTVKKKDGHTYYWFLDDNIKADSNGDMSNKYFIKGDCSLYRFKVLSAIYYKKPMGKEQRESFTPKDPEWSYAPPNSNMHNALDKVCRI